MRTTLRRGGTIVDVLAVVLISFAVVGAVAAEIRRSREIAYWVKCASNLKWVGTGLMQYASANRGQFPRTLYDAATADRPTAYTQPDALHPFAADGPSPNDVTAAYFLLVRDGSAPLNAFVCPSSPIRIGNYTADVGDPATRSNFPSQTFLGYSFANPYPDAAAVKNGYRLDVRLTAEFAIAADMNPGTPELLSTGYHASRRQVLPALSFNHRPNAAMNVMYGDLHIDVMPTPFVGVQRENIFTAGPTTATSGGTRIGGSLTGANDSVLLPVADISAWRSILDREKRIERTQRWLIAAGISCAIAIVVGALALMWRRYALRGRSAPVAD